jgi:transcriptional regulator with XRE-family HTH domain/DNA-directed RNA polymerase subunit RPC12/RpoP
MDQVKIGRFIAEKRREQGLTQAQLAEKLSITDRAVSKWENGRTMPDSSLMLDLCKHLKITVNDLLNGEVVSMENYNEKVEKQLLEVIKQKEEADKRLLALEWVVGILSVIVLIVPIIIAAYVQMEDWLRVLLVFSGFIPCIVGFCWAIKIEQVAGYYKCAHCGHTYVPTMKSVLWSMHMGRTRYMRCPECHKKSWQKKVISKD